mgnify:CR=1 FL=1
MRIQLCASSLGPTLAPVEPASQSAERRASSIEPPTPGADNNGGLIQFAWRLQAAPRVGDVLKFGNKVELEVSVAELVVVLGAGG